MGRKPGQWEPGAANAAAMREGPGYLRVRSRQACEAAGVGGVGAPGAWLLLGLGSRGRPPLAREPQAVPGGVVPGLAPEGPRAAPWGRTLSPQDPRSRGGGRGGAGSRGQGRLVGGTPRQVGGLRRRLPAAASRASFTQAAPPPTLGPSGARGGFLGAEVWSSAK